MIDQAHNLRVRMQQARAQESAVVPPGRTTGQCRSIAVTSGKGGVGKTNIALMVSITLARLNKKVLVLDADLGLANVHILLGVAPQHTLQHLLDQSATLEQTIYAAPQGVDILAGASGLERLANLDSLQLELLRRRLSGLEGQYEYLIVDTGAGIGRTTIEFCRNADTVLLVLTPEPTSLADAYAMVKILYDKGQSRIGVVVNMAASDREGRDIFDKLNALVVKFLKKPLALIDIIPYDGEIPKMVRRQQTIVVEQPHRKVSLRLQAVARKLCGLSCGGSPGFFARLFGTQLSGVIDDKND